MSDYLEALQTERAHVVATSNTPERLDAIDAEIARVEEEIASAPPAPGSEPEAPVDDEPTTSVDDDEDPAVDDVDADDLEELDKPGLLARAAELGVEVNERLGGAKLRDAIREAQA